MRIGIITQPLIQNYGGVLQNYALQQVLLRLGHTARTIDYVPSRDWKERVKHILWSYLHFRKPNKWDMPPKRQHAVKDFVYQHIVTTGPVRKYRARTVRSYGFDALIAGSDQIWRPIYNQYLFDMYFRFAEQLPIKKIVYGASFGVDKWEYDIKQTRYCRELVHKIDAVSVRERNGVDFCKNYFGMKAQWVLDPTLLLDSGDYEKICSQTPIPANPFIAAYILDRNKQILEQVLQIGETLGLPIRMFSADTSMELSIEEWLVLLRGAQYVITDSFHGTVFSIIFNRAFISIGTMDRGMDRFNSLLGQFGLLERLSTEITADRLLRPISWKEVNRKKELLKNRSIQFLCDVLKS